jgi:ribulose-5-phosphate 4-epimerase/fuculose-1-phosphate aldolase
VIVDFDGNTVEGNLRPSSDTKTHAVLYKIGTVFQVLFIHTALTETALGTKLKGNSYLWDYITARLSNISRYSFASANG